MEQIDGKDQDFKFVMKPLTNAVLSRLIGTVSIRSLPFPIGDDTHDIDYSSTMHGIEAHMFTRNSPSNFTRTIELQDLASTSERSVRVHTGAHVHTSRVCDQGRCVRTYSSLSDRGSCDHCKNKLYLHVRHRNDIAHGVLVWIQRWCSLRSVCFRSELSRMLRIDRGDHHRLMAVAKYKIL